MTLKSRYKNYAAKKICDKTRLKNRISKKGANQ